MYLVQLLQIGTSRPESLEIDPDRYNSNYGFLSRKLNPVDTGLTSVALGRSELIKMNQLNYLISTKAIYYSIHRSQSRVCPIFRRSAILRDFDFGVARGRRLSIGLLTGVQRSTFNVQR